MFIYIYVNDEWLDAKLFSSKTAFVLRPLKGLLRDCLGIVWGLLGECLGFAEALLGKPCAS